MTNRGKAQHQIDRYLARVGRATAQLDPSERADILDGLRAHIQDELANRGASSPGMDDVRAVLSSMDDPQSYRGENGIEASFKTGRSLMFGRLGFYFVLAALPLSALSLLLGATVADVLSGGGLLLAGILAVCGLGLGIVGWRSPLGKAAVICAVLALASATIFIEFRVTPSSSNSSQSGVETHTGP